MKITVLLMVSGMALSLTFGAKNSSRCPETWTTFGKSCYKYIEEKTTWFDAQVICMTAGSHLLRIDSEDEDKFAANISRIHISDVWIGLSDLLHEGRFVWDTTQQTPTYTNWAPGQPDNLQFEDCVLLWFEQWGAWNDFPCDTEMSSICEKPILPETTKKESTTSSTRKI